MIALNAHDLARAADVKPVYAQRVIGEIKTGKRTNWRGATPQLCAGEPSKIVLSSLPIEIREAVMMWDQMDLPLLPPITPPPVPKLNLTEKD